MESCENNGSGSAVSRKAPLMLTSRTRAAPLMPAPAEMQTRARQRLRMPQRCSMWGNLAVWIAVTCQLSGIWVLDAFMV